MQQHRSISRRAASLLVALTPAAAAVIAALMAAGPTAAATPLVHETDDGVEVLAVDYRDLNLSEPSGARAMLSRLRGASGRVCRAGAPAAPVILGTAQAYRACANAAMDRAVRDLGAPAVTALYAGEFPDRPSAPR